jgi:hypothetical protein
VPYLEVGDSPMSICTGEGVDPRPLQKGSTGDPMWGRWRMGWADRCPSAGGWGGEGRGGAAKMYHMLSITSYQVLWPRHHLYSAQYRSAGVHRLTYSRYSDTQT